jgi:tRNA pseudouridine55 synthase
MNGILLINKEKGMTSFEVVEKIKQKFNIQKVGHSGTLDPLGKGLLIILINKATKINSYISYPKEYLIEIKFGMATDTDDLEGKIIKETPVPENLEQRLLQVLPEFTGEIMQVPPKYSAIKKNGEKLYELARTGVEFEVQPKKVNIYNINLLGATNNTATLLVTCSTGTYMRSLARDIGEKIGSAAVLSDLTRTKIGNFSVEKSLKLEEIKSIENNLISIKDALYELPEVVINEKQYEFVKNGNSITLENCFTTGIVKLIFKNEVVAIASIWNGVVKIKRGI